MFVPADLFLVGLDDVRVIGGDDQVEQLVDFPINPRNSAFARCDHVAGLRAPRVPLMFEHGRQQLNGTDGRLERLDDLADLAFQHIAPDRFAIGLAVLRLADVIGIAAPIAACERRAQGCAAAGAFRNAAQGKFVADVLSTWRIGTARAAGLDTLERLHRDQRLVLPFQPLDAVVIRADMPGIERMGQHVDHALLGDPTGLAAWKIEHGFGKPFDLGDGSEVARGIALECLAHDAVQRRVEKKDFAAPFDFLVDIADGRIVHPIAVLHARFLSCTYIGWSGIRTERAQAGRCPWLRQIRGAN
ncbi:MAG: hypothetical protein QNJ44_20085 [Rhodobacter sp.]|nr:hypothetical protein [Rhodobacter sp.]